MSSLNLTLMNSLTDGSNVETPYSPVAIIDPSATTALDLQDFAVSIGATDLEINLNSLTCRYMVLKATGVLSVKLNSAGATVIVGDFLVIGKGVVTSLFLTNATGSVVTADIRCFT